MTTIKINDQAAPVCGETWHYVARADAPYGWVIYLHGWSYGLHPFVVLGAFSLSDALEVAAGEAVDTMPGLLHEPDPDGEEEGYNPFEDDSLTYTEAGFISSEWNARPLTQKDAWEAAKVLGVDPYEATGHDDFREVCSDCLAYIANGDAPDPGFPACTPAFDEAEGWGYDEFSHYACDCCGAGAGARYRVLVREAE